MQRGKNEFRGCSQAFNNITIKCGIQIDMLKIIDIRHPSKNHNDESDDDDNDGAV